MDETRAGSGRAEGEIGGAAPIDGLIIGVEHLEAAGLTPVEIEEVNGDAGDAGIAALLVGRRGEEAVFGVLEFGDGPRGVGCGFDLPRVFTPFGDEAEVGVGGVFVAPGFELVDVGK